MENTKGRRFVVGKIFKEQGAAGSFYTPSRILAAEGFKNFQFHPLNF
jgi:hypothetical protein